MNFLALVVVLACFLSIYVLAASDDAEGVRKVVAGFETAYAMRHGRIGKLFAPDADFLNVAGAPMKGRKDIQTHHGWSHGAIPQTTQIAGANPANYGIFKNSTMKFDDIDVRFLREDVAIAM